MDRAHFEPTHTAGAATERMSVGWASALLARAVLAPDARLTLVSEAFSGGTNPPARTQRRPDVVRENGRRALSLFGRIEKVDGHRNQEVS
jgi:hypothetical protein